jgi:hypothetical protein
MPRPCDAAVRGFLPRFLLLAKGLGRICAALGLLIVSLVPLGATPPGGEAGLRTAITTAAEPVYYRRIYHRGYYHRPYYHRPYYRRHYYPYYRPYYQRYYRPYYYRPHYYRHYYRPYYGPYYRPYY